MKNIKSYRGDNKNNGLKLSKRPFWVDLMILIIIIYNLLIIIAIGSFGLTFFLELGGTNDRSLVGILVFLVDLVLIFSLEQVIEVKDDSNYRSMYPSNSYSFELFFSYWMGFYTITLALIKYQSQLDGYCDSENNKNDLIGLVWALSWILPLIISLVYPFRNRSINITKKLAFLSSWLHLTYIVIFHLIAVYLFPFVNDPCPVGF